LTAHTPGYLDAVLSFYRPQISVVTLVGDDHIKTFASRESIAEEKGKIVACLPPDGVAVLNADDPLVRAMAERTRARILLYGLSEDADLRASDVQSAWPDRLSMVLHYGGQSVAVRTQLVGDFWSCSILAATAVALSCGLSLQDCAARLATFPPVRSRMEPFAVDGGITFIDNTYKNPHWGVPALLRAVAAARAPRKIVVFGGCNHIIGPPDAAYAAMVRQALDVADLVYFAGSDTKWLDGFDPGEARRRYQTFATTHDLNEHLGEILQPGDLVFLASDRDIVHLERLIVDRTDRVVCWREGCKIPRHCRDCRWYQSAAAA
jgi:UDP-N-acetylmuramoyl-tripeptide--D-alanyl-D-alanine ligase